MCCGLVNDIASGTLCHPETLAFKVVGRAANRVLSHAEIDPPVIRQRFRPSAHTLLADHQAVGRAEQCLNATSPASC